MCPQLNSLSSSLLYFISLLPLRPHPASSQAGSSHSRRPPLPHPHRPPPPPWHEGQLSAGPWRPLRKTSLRLLPLLQPIPPLPAPLSSSGRQLPGDRLPKSGQQKSPTRHSPNSAWHLIPKKGLYELQQVTQLVAFCLSWRYNENQKSVLRCDGSWCIVQTCRLVRSRGWNLLCGSGPPSLANPHPAQGPPPPTASLHVLSPSYQLVPSRFQLRSTLQFCLLPLNPQRHCHQMLPWRLTWLTSWHPRKFKGVWTGASQALCLLPLTQKCIAVT